jgi:hypothetical protein
MAWKRRMQGGVLGVVGFILSPLSWWNDAVVNLPLALGFGWVVARFHKPAFEPAVIVGYWLTNVLGLVLMHKGVQKMANGEEKRYTRRDLAKDVGISVLYTVLIVVLIRAGFLRPIENYFPNNRPVTVEKEMKP